jgi:3-deoxy-manno-octulosonate cytidylyltransferase (CMP-KDO synthetase)
MICRVVECALAARNVTRAIVATDDERILEAVKSAGFEAVLTRTDHASGTDRIAEVAATLDDADIIVNVQGDEPLISPLTIERAVQELGERGRGKREDAETRRLGDTETNISEAMEVGIVTTWEPMESAADVLNPDVVKVVVDDRERAIYFSRSPVPYPRDAVRAHGSIAAAILKEPALLTTFRKHTGLYVYRRDILLKFATWSPSDLERAESLEQLRALEHGVRIKVIKASTSSIGVDTSEDLERIRNLVSSSEFQVSSSL